MSHKWTASLTEHVLDFDINEEKYTVYLNHDEGDENTPFGIVDYLDKYIWIRSKLPLSGQIKTLTHELMHCYIFEASCSLETYDEEDLCNLTMNAYPFITRVLSRYKQKIEDKGALLYDTNDTAA